MIIVRAPYRCSFFGGGTDYPTWFRRHGGAVLTSTIDRYCYLSVRRMPPFLGTKYRVFWSKMEAVDRLEDIEHPGVKGCLQFLGVKTGIEVNHAGDLPARSGLGSSSAFTVGMLHALHALKGEVAGPTQLANEAIRVEQDVLKETVGVQDQIECAFGGLNHIVIRPDGRYAVHPITIPLGAMEDLQDRLLLFFTGVQRHASEIAAAQVGNFQDRAAELTAIADMVPVAVSCLSDGDLDHFGELLHETWTLKRRLSDKVSSGEIDALYERATKAGALGGKVLGAGGGGFMLFYVPKSKQIAVRAALNGLIEIPFRFGNEGSRVVLYEP